MTVFVLVSGPFTGGWVWEETAGRLREAGAEPYPVTLTGMGERGGEGGPGTDLETHIEELVRLIDGTDATELVLVGHGYGLHPVFGAADRRPERIARIVALDTGLPRDGEAAARSVPDPETRARLERGTGTETGSGTGTGTGAGSAGHGGPVPPPTRGTWHRWGSTEGIAAEALERLERRAAPQPSGTLTQPLRLTGAADALPTTGVLCTANGSSVDLVQMLVESGPPQFRALADERIRFLELATGHWPMLSAPAELSGVLLRAAAGEGHRLTAPARDHENGHGHAPGHGHGHGHDREQPTHLLPFLMDVPEGPRERLGRVDLHLPAADGPGEPAGRPRPAVVFVHGGPVTPDQRPTPRDTPFFLGYGRYAASLGAVGVTLDHRLYGLGDYPRAADDLAEAVELVRADPRVDGDRVALWFFSTGGLLAADWLAAPPPWLRCVAASYPALAPLPGWGAVESRFRPVDAVGSADGPPIVLTRAGREHPAFAETVQEFLDAAARNGADVEVVDVPLGHHGFELVDPTEESRAAVERAMRSVLGHLRD
ncbi:dienelactone hydrolase family protein [Streptomyces sp. NPDC059352]|uniref:dienelactone hydrolase family protein n=1 Tax=Streptomyces sp. NPDC059352 TaxID=3346810 RepID=UPI0036CB7059